jgi:hypothetical protein
MKRYFLILPGVVLILSILVSCAPPKSRVPAGTLATPSQQNDIQKMREYVDHLIAEGLSVYVQISAEDGKPYIFIMRPATDEITDEEIGNIGKLVLHAAAFFRDHKEFHEEEINISFQRPKEHRIALIKRESALESGGQARGEISLTVYQGNVISIVNLAGPKKNGRQDYANAWSTIQAVCLAFAINIEDSDPICNIISANAAAGWTGINRSEAEQMITAYGSTRLEYLGNQDYQYRFIPSIYDSFKSE